MKHQRLIKSFNSQGLNPHRDTPCEILHTVELGNDKYIWHETNKVWDKKKDAQFAIRLQSSSTDGLSLPPLRSHYMVQYKNSLIGKHFKALQQLAVFHLHSGLCSKALFDLWKANGALGALIWYPEIKNIDEYLVSCSPNLMIVHYNTQNLPLHGRLTYRFFSTTCSIFGPSSIPPGFSTSTNYTSCHILKTTFFASGQPSYLRRKFLSAGTRFFGCAVSCQTIKHRALTSLPPWLEWNVSNTKSVVAGGKTVPTSMSRQVLECVISFSATRSFVGVWVLLIEAYLLQVSSH